ncbi:peptide ABC transporter permease [Sorangium cellulosum]|uniref:Peptide ABC transporter permease n=1 Tax=Sorangium cellulosum TaxID=56 RepID=A0A4P2Q0Y9_SORCE|nr:ABC transporter substrate-binding protein [Sorangium cellulosum]AUX22887.1 peptide ABC transporter permease [Sorangium cellulosum]
MLRAGRALLGDDAARRFRQDRSARLGLGLVALLALFAAAGPAVIAHDPNASDFSLSRDAFGAPPGPSAAHWLGTDPLFRDLLARLAHGARLSLVIALSSTALAVGLGALVGVAAGMAHGTRAAALDGALMRLVDVILALPYLLLVTAIGVAVGRADVGTTLLVLGLTGWTGAARLVRAKTIELAQRDFVASARALGAGPLHVVRRHILPNVGGTLLALATVSAGQMLLAEAALGYLGVGVQPPTATWGRMLHEAEPYLGVKPLLVAAPGFAILLAVLGFHRVGEGLRDALDPAGAELPRGRRLPVDLLIAGAALLLLSGGSPSRVRPPRGGGPPPAAPVRGGTLRVATTVHARALDPAISYDELSGIVADHVFARLVTWDQEGQIVPDLARAIEVERGGRTYVFTLREGVRFHDGAELRAADVKRSIERTLHPGTPSPGASQYEMIEGFDAFHRGAAPHLAGVRVLGDAAIAIDLRAPDATFLPRMTLAFMAPVCPSSGAVVDPTRPPAPCGAGPFRVERWDQDGRIRLVRHEGYFRPGRPYLDAIEWQTGMRATTQRYRFEEGELDYLRDLTAIDAAAYRADPAWEGQRRWTPQPRTNAIFLNTELPPFDRLAVRRAVALAVDPSVLEKVRPDLVAIDRVLPESIPGPPRDEPMRRHDLPAALAEMAAAGYPYDPATGQGGYPGVIDYIAIPDTMEQAVGEIFQQQLARVGLRVRLRLVSWATYLAEASRRRTIPMGWAGWQADFPDPASFFEPTLSSRAIRDEGSQNFAFFRSEALDRALDAAHVEQDRARRLALYARAEAIVRDLAPWVPTYTRRLLELWQPSVRGYERSAVLSPRFHDVWLDPAARRAARGGGPRAGGPLASRPRALLARAGLPR